jgi:hypothetical protein
MESSERNRISNETGVKPVRLIEWAISSLAIFGFLALIFWKQD